MVIDDSPLGLSSRVFSSADERVLMSDARKQRSAPGEGEMWMRR